MVAARTPVASCGVRLIRHDPGTNDVAIGAGKNSARTLSHRNVVRELLRLGQWNGGARKFSVPALSMPGLATAALLQIADGGSVLSASQQASAP